MGFTDNQQPATQQPSHNLKMMEQAFYQPKSSTWFDLRVFYLKVSNFDVKRSTPERLTLVYVPLGPHTILRVNGKRECAYLDHVSSQLRCDRVDKNTEEVTFVNTDCIEVTGSVGFEVLDGEDILISGVLQLQNAGNFVWDDCKKWTLNCRSHIVTNGRRHDYFGEVVSPLADVYVAGSFYGNPIILTNTIEPLPSLKNSRISVLDTIPEHESTDVKKNTPSDALQPLNDSLMDDIPDDIYAQDDFRRGYHLERYMEDENGELSWFNAGVRVGVGISLGICIGVGLGVGLLAKTFQATSTRYRKIMFL